jgi:hypothetical protein
MLGVGKKTTLTAIALNNKRQATMSDLEGQSALNVELKEYLKKVSQRQSFEIHQLYVQLENLSWLQKNLKIKGALPSLRGWPTSPDFLLKLHSWLLKNKPKLVVETGSGASTLVIADALRQNGVGKLISLEHLQEYADKTYETLADEELTQWVELRVGALKPWKGEHLNPKDAEKPSRWYPLNLEGIHQIDLLVVDGPPGNTCLYARYPALPAFFERLAPTAEVWMDDANRQEEKEISEEWAKRYGFVLEFVPLEKGMSRLTRRSAKTPSTVPITANHTDTLHPERALGLDFSLPEE